MDPDQTREDLLHFLDTVARPDQRIYGVADDVNLIDAGLIDSFALIQIILYLEERFGLNIRRDGVDTGDLASVAGILGAIARTE